MRNQQRLTGIESQEKALVAAAVVIIWQDLDDDTVAGDLHATLVFLIGADQSVVGLGPGTRRIDWSLKLAPAKVDGD